MTRAVRAVEVAVDRQQPVAEQRDQVAQVALAPREVRGVRDGHVVVGLGPEHEHDVAVEDAQREDRAVALVGLEQQRQRVARERVVRAQSERRVAGRERHRRAALGAHVAGHPRERVRRDRGGRAQRHDGEEFAALTARRHAVSGAASLVGAWQGAPAPWRPGAVRGAAGVVLLALVVLTAAFLVARRPFAAALALGAARGARPARTSRSGCPRRRR